LTEVQRTPPNAEQPFNHKSCLHKTSLMRLTGHDYRFFYIPNVINEHLNSINEGICKIIVALLLLRSFTLMKKKSYHFSFTLPLAADAEVLLFFSIVFGDLSFSAFAGSSFWLSIRSPLIFLFWH
jgi:hypothetical protein